MPFIKKRYVINFTKYKSKKSDKEYSYFAHFDDLFKVEKLFTN